MFLAATLCSTLLAIGLLASMIPPRGSTLVPDSRQWFSRTDSPSLRPHTTDEQIFDIDHARPSANLHSKLEEYPPPYPTISTSLSHPASNSLSPRSFTRYMDMAYRWLIMQYRIAVVKTIDDAKIDTEYAFDAWTKFVGTIDSTRPTSNFTLTLGSLQLDFRSQALITWTVVANIIKGFSFTLIMGVAMFGRQIWYLTKVVGPWVAVVVTFRHIELLGAGHVR
ncbi:MAG: hypothetical protein LQ339_002444 [Xanthoria mediterranea]|nr:MAG: hypothetical protein LQ339_002444 [Xanthoria mediterranea]